MQVRQCWSTSSDDASENNSLVFASEYEFLKFLSNAIQSGSEQNHIGQIVEQRMIHLEKKNI
jgi:hypothetical protein